jgi:hypothetical protein
MRCPSCGEEEGNVIQVSTTCPDPDEPGEFLVFAVCTNCDYGINEHTEGTCTCRKEMGLSTYTVDVLLRAAFSLTHQIHEATALGDFRAQRDLIVAEIKRRCRGE